jgi:hypothetical protein
MLVFYLVSSIPSHPLSIARGIRMRLSVFSCLVLLLGAVIVGCGSDEPRRATDGASQQALEEYEAAVAAAEGSMQESIEEDPAASEE